jgi:subtilase family serine protease
MPTLTPYNLGTAEGWAWESALDIEYAHTMAPGANILLVISPTSGDDLYVDIEYVVNNSLANFISLSWASPEDVYYIPPPSYNLLYAYDEIFMQAAAEGIGVFAASGDWGAFDLFIIPFEPSVWYPASDPWVTGVGGTELYVQFINGITQRMETAWNWNPFFMWGSSGGYSFTFNETPGQALISIPYELPYVYEPNLGIWFNTVGHRGVPDIAADADPFTGVLIVLNGVIPPYFIGGTSLATPLSAGMTTTVQSAVPMFTIGDLAPNLYLIYHYMPSEAYVSITNVTELETSNFFTGIPGAMFPTLGGDNGLYWAVPGMWNPVTGLGQINVYGLAQALNGLANK